VDTLRSDIDNRAGFSAIDRTNAAGEIVKERPIELPCVKFIALLEDVAMCSLAGGRIAASVRTPRVANSTGSSLVHLLVLS
jgi:hypothetical protein